MERGTQRRRELSRERSAFVILVCLPASNPGKQSILGIH
jgi:hypothetical protein